MPRRREAGHVASKLGDKHLGRAPGDPRNRVEPRERVGVRGGARHDLAVAGRDGVLDELDVAQELVEQEAMMGGDAAGECLGERRATQSGYRMADVLAKVAAELPAADAK